MDLYTSIENGMQLSIFVGRNVPVSTFRLLDENSMAALFLDRGKELGVALLLLGFTSDHNLLMFISGGLYFGKFNAVKCNLTKLTTKRSWYLSSGQRSAVGRAGSVPPSNVACFSVAYRSGFL